MRMFLDSRDLILLVERGSDEVIADFCEWLRYRDGHLVISLSLICEICVPLSVRGNQDSVMRTLARIEQIPHLFIAEAKIHRDEIVSAVNSFSLRREYVSIDPYVGRFDEVVSPFRLPATKIYLTYGIAQTVFELWQENPQLFVQDVRHPELLAASRNLDRADAGNLRHRANFSTYVHRTLTQFGIMPPDGGVDALANWIWSDWHRCPSMRLGYEVYHQILRNVTDVAGAADMGDLTHISCLPYVEAMTLDRRMRGYIAQSDRALISEYANKVFADIPALRASYA